MILFKTIKIANSKSKGTASLDNMTRISDHSSRFEGKSSDDDDDDVACAVFVFTIILTMKCNVKS